MPTVHVLMSTYNGEKFIAEQLDSILRQTGVSVKLYIRDDGSTDRTFPILEQYAAGDDRIILARGENLGPGKSFMQLLKTVPDAAYYAFADQDDVWMEDKLDRAVRLIREKEQSEERTLPILYASNQMLVDADLHEIGIRFKTPPALDFYELLSRNMIYGCTMVLNHTLRTVCVVAPMPRDQVLRAKNHDAWVLYAGMLAGEVIYDHESRILYRQHGENVVGGIRPSGFAIVTDRMKRLTARRKRGVRSMLAGDLLKAFSDYMDASVKEHLVILENADSLTGAVKLIRDPVLKRSFRESTPMILFRGLIRWI